jgi:L-aminopeptidase/D-esterase-like protein
MNDKESSKVLKDAITDVPGIKVGHSQDLKAGTGCTVVICERGGAPGTRETDLLNPVNLVDKAHAIYLGGGSAFGLDGASGVMKYLEERGIGFDVVLTKVPIVPGAVLFDLAVGDYKIRPDAKMGYEACLNASDAEVSQGNVGAGTGATVGKIFGGLRCMKSGLGTASFKSQELIIGAIVAVNCLGDVIDPENGEITIGVIATNARLTKAGATKVAMMAQDGYARTISPAHTMFDGDTIFCMATGEVEAGGNVVGAITAEVMARAIVKAVKSAESLYKLLSYRDLFEK